MKIYLIKCNYDGTIEGFIREKEDFDKWLSKHNERRDEEDKEYKDEFELIEVCGVLE